MDTINDLSSPYASTYAVLFLLLPRIFAIGSVVSLLAYVSYYEFLSPLSGIPGPFIARFTRLWLAYHGWKGDFHSILTEVHDKYGTTVRIGPDEVLTISPEAVRKIYGMERSYLTNATSDPVLFRCRISVQQESFLCPDQGHA